MAVMSREGGGLQVTQFGSPQLSAEDAGQSSQLGQGTRAGGCKVMPNPVAVPIERATEMI
jgi:hypothetical protein